MKGWDQNVVYSNTLVVMIGKGFHEFQLPHIHPEIEIRRLSDDHPAAPGFGVFAKRPLVRFETTAHYAGVVTGNLLLPTPYDFEMKDYIVTASSR
jgi:hypothetical protein